MRIAVIPARGGSKRIPKKNIKEFHGKPIIAWSIETAIKSNIFDKIIVSTDNKEIADISIRYGALVPFMRPEKLSDDYTDTGEVILHAINWLNKNNIMPDSICCIYPTSPLMLSEDLITASKLIEDYQDSYALTVTAYETPISRSLKINKYGLLEPLDIDSIKKRSQDLEEAYHDAGQFYFAKTRLWLRNRNILENKNKPIFIPRHRSQDIDNIEDWILAETLFTLLDSS